MITVIKILGTLAVLVILTGFMPVVSELPLGMDDALIFFVGTIKALLTLMPWMGIVFTLFLLALLIKSLLFAWHWVRWFIELVNG